MKYKYIVLDYLRKGNIFGEHSVVNGVKNPYSIEVVSQKAIVFKIKKNLLIKLGKRIPDLID